MTSKTAILAAVLADQSVRESACGVRILTQRISPPIDFDRYCAAAS
jgi:hypothetical protein